MDDRAARIDLGGQWQLALDPDCEGLINGWATGRFPLENSAQVEVPSLWNLTYPDYEGVAFYRKTFPAPRSWAGQIGLLQFEGACYRTEAWINGCYMGSHEGAYTPFCFDATQALRFGEENELVLRVASLSKNGPVDGVLLKHCPTSKQSWYYTHGGVWGKVWLERRPPVYIASLLLEPDLRRELVRVEVALENRLCEMQEMQIELRLTGPDGEPAGETHTSLATPPGLARHSFRLPLPQPLVWSCETPHLYRARVDVCSPGGDRDMKEDHFGMRDFTVRDGQYFLNGEPLFLKGVLLQPHYPATQITPADPEMMLHEVTLMKEAGFNLIRCHVRPAPPGYLEITDRLGMLVYAESSLAWIRESPRFFEHGERELREMIARDRNHPSVVIWGILEENPPASALGSDHFLSYARALDPTRVVLDNSGGSMVIDQAFAWLDRAHVLADRESIKQKIVDTHLYLGNYLAPGTADWLRRLGRGASIEALLQEDLGVRPVLEEFERECRTYTGKIFVSEIGGGGMTDLEATHAQFGDQTHLVDAQEIEVLKDSLLQGFAKRGLERIFGSPAEMAAASQDIQAGGDVRQIEALLCNPRISGFNLTQLNDVGWEFHAGILDMWRNPKQVYHALSRVNASQALVLRAASPVVSCGDQVPVSVTLVQHKGHATAGEVQVEVSGGEGQAFSTKFPAPGRAGIHELGAVAVDSGHGAGPYTLSARYFNQGKLLAESKEIVLALPTTSLEDVLPGMAWVGEPVKLPDGEAGRVSPYRPEEARDHPDTRTLVVAFPATLALEEWQAVLEAVAEGRTALIGPLHPGDERAVQAFRQRGLEIQVEQGMGSWIGCYHWVPASPVFSGLPAGGFAGEAYIDVLPKYSLGELGGEVLAGAVRSQFIVGGKPEFLWYSDIEEVEFGRGRLIFCQYRIFDRLSQHPLARRLFYNMASS